jgi:hypothetical protein
MFIRPPLMQRIVVQMLRKLPTLSAFYRQQEEFSALRSFLVPGSVFF